MKTPAIIASLTVVGSIAYAAGAQAVAGKQFAVFLSGSQAHSMQQQTLMGSSVASDCPAGIRLDWFSPVPHRIGCGGPSLTTPLGADYGPAQDVNGDGEREYWYAAYGAVTVLQDGNVTQVPDETRDIVISRIDLGTNATVWDSIRVVPRDFGTWVKSQIPNCGWATIYFQWGTPGFVGWRDMDGDGDLDFVTLVSFNYSGNGNGGGAFQVWFENTGFQKQPRLVGDLNGDGKVNGADLGTLLVNWTN
jgi:hypothetical protein